MFTVWPQHGTAALEVPLTLPELPALLLDPLAGGSSLCSWRAVWSWPHVL